jgi:hypothetical protein
LEFSKNYFSSNIYRKFSLIPFWFFTRIANHLSQARLKENAVSPDFPLVVVYPVDSEIRLIQLASGVDASVEPLLKHAGLVCELGGPIEVAMNGITGTSRRIRQFLTSESNDLDYEMLAMLKEEFNEPAGRARRKENMRERLRLVHPQPSQTPEPEAAASDTPEP